MRLLALLLSAVLCAVGCSRNPEQPLAPGAADQPIDPQVRVTRFKRTVLHYCTEATTAGNLALKGGHPNDYNRGLAQVTDAFLKIPTAPDPSYAPVVQVTQSVYRQLLVNKTSIRHAYDLATSVPQTERARLTAAREMEIVRETTLASLKALERIKQQVE